MKKISIFLLMLFSIYSYSQTYPEPCEPDCEDDLWLPASGLPAIEYTLITDCGSINVRYRVRFACNQYHDVFIETIGTGFESINDCVFTYFGGDYSSFVNYIIEQLIIANPMNFPPTTVGCEDNWRVMKGACWSRYFVDSVRGENYKQKSQNTTQSFNPYLYGDFLAPCDEFCCLEFYMVCIDSNGNRNITQTDYYPPTQQECDLNNRNLASGECFPVCGSIYRGNK